MADTKASPGLKAQAGSLHGGAVLTLLNNLAIKSKDDDKRTISLSAIAGEVELPEPKLIELLKDLADEEHQLVVDLEKLGPGAQLQVHHVAYHLTVIQAPLPYDRAKDKAAKPEPAPLIIRPPRAGTADFTAPDGTAYRGEVKEIKPKGRSKEPVHFLLRIAVQNKEDKAKWDLVVTDEKKDSMADAWVFFDKYVGNVPTILAWAIEQVQDSSLKLEPKTFEALCCFYRDEKPEDLDRKLICNTAITEKGGTLTIQWKAGRVIFRRADGGLVFPFLDVPAAVIPPPKEQPAEAPAEPQVDAILDRPFDLEGGVTVHVRIVQAGPEWCKATFTGPVSETGEMDRSPKNDEFEGDPATWAAREARRLVEKFAEATGGGK